MRLASSPGPTDAQSNTSAAGVQSDAKAVEKMRPPPSCGGEDRGGASASPPEVSNPAIHVSSKLSLYQTRTSKFAVQGTSRM
jgi:hypothetical protein